MMPDQIFYLALIARANVISSEINFHICLAGHKVSNDWPLIKLLSDKHAVTVIQDADALHEQRLLCTANALVLDCSGRGDEVAHMIAHLKVDYPLLCVLIVDGGLTQRQLAGAFQGGASDYFPVPYDIHLLAERVSSLCNRPQPVRKE